MKKIFKKILETLICMWLGAFVPFMFLTAMYINTGFISVLGALLAGVIYMFVLLFMFVLIGGNKK